MLNILLRSAIPHSVHGLGTRVVRGTAIQGDVAFDDDISVSLLEVDLGGSTSARAA